jgi:hypothetical protein
MISRPHHAAEHRFLLGRALLGHFGNQKPGSSAVRSVMGESAAMVHSSMTAASPLYTVIPGNIVVGILRIEGIQRGNRILPVEPVIPDAPIVAIRFSPRNFSRPAPGTGRFCSLA